MISYVTNKEEITRKILPLIDSTEISDFDYAMKTWWVNIRNTGGLCLTALGDKVFRQAKIECYDLILGGYSDWYLPSKDELNKIYINRNVFGGFTPSVYWTSSENNTSFVWTQYFNNGYQGSILKNETHYVRAIRRF